MISKSILCWILLTKWNNLIGRKITLMSMCGVNVIHSFICVSKNFEKIWHGKILDLLSTMVFIVLRKQPYLFLYLMACVLWTVCISLPLSVYVRLSRYELKSVSDKTLWEEASSGNMIQHKGISLSHSVILAGEDWETSQIPCGPLKSLSSLPLPFPSLSHSPVVTLTPTLSSLKKTRFF